MIDSLPYKTFLKLKSKYTPKMILLTDKMMSIPGVHLAYKDHRHYVTEMFSREGIEVVRFGHNYKSLDTKTPELGVVFMANDSQIIPGLEAWVLIGHNAKYKDT